MSDGDPGDLLPNGDYIVVRTELRSGRVLLMYLPDGLTTAEADEIISELGETSAALRKHHGSAPPAACASGMN